ncbi:MAG: hypothetical protein ACTSR5_18090 [Promethearchaeota archaeon]
MSNTNGIIALIFGIIGLCCAWLIPIPFVPFLFPIVAIVFGVADNSEILYKVQTI